MSQYIVGIDQSTQGTKALLLDAEGNLIARTDRPHRQIISPEGWVSHDGEEIYRNTVLAVGELLRQSGVSVGDILALGISNQRETTIGWDRTTGESIADAIVWQCARAKGITDEFKAKGVGEAVRRTTGIPLSPYYPAAKMSWLLQNVSGAAEMARAGKLCLGTIDAWLLFRLTGGQSFQTDWSNASRTQLLNLNTLSWDKDICQLFGVPMSCLPEITDSDSFFGVTTLEGLFDRPVPIRAMMGDSHAALFGQGCHGRGMIKATYGTGSSIMMNVGDCPVFSEHGVVTSLGWGIGGKVSYVLEGNINYTGAVITWLKDDLGLIKTSAEAGSLAAQANPDDGTVLVPAFSGLGAPYWDSGATAIFTGMTRTTGRKELVRAAEESIAFQITDVVRAMEADAGIPVVSLRVDGGPTRDAYLMQFQSDMLGIPVEVPEAEELSGIGAAWLAGLATGLYDQGSLFSGVPAKIYRPVMENGLRREKYRRWQSAVDRSLAVTRRTICELTGTLVSEV